MLQLKTELRESNERVKHVEDSVCITHCIFSAEYEFSIHYHHQFQYTHTHTLLNNIIRVYYALPTITTQLASFLGCKVSEKECASHL